MDAQRRVGRPQEVLFMSLETKIRIVMLGFCLAIGGTIAMGVKAARGEAPVGQTNPELLNFFRSLRNMDRELCCDGFDGFGVNDLQVSGGDRRPVGRGRAAPACRRRGGRWQQGRPRDRLALLRPQAHPLLPAGRWRLKENRRQVSLPAGHRRMISQL
jgi:hypothetical protein